MRNEKKRFLRKTALIILFLISHNSFLITQAQAVDVKIVEANGVKAWLVEDHILPIVAVNMAFKNAGSAHDTVEGLGYQVASMLNEGAGEYTSREYQKLLEENAIGFSPDLDKDNFYITVKSLKENLDLAADLTNLAITKPKFDESDYARVKGQTLIGLKKEDESEGEVAGKVFEKTVYGTHPYSRHKEGAIESVTKITTAELHQYVASDFAKDNLIISIVGDVNKEEARVLLEKLTANLPEKAKVAELPEFTAYPKGAVTSVKMENPQTYVVFGEKGIARQDKDYYAAYILNHILGGGGFQARLMTEVREKNGLAYGIGTSLQSMNKADMFVGTVSSKNKSVEQVINIIQAEFKRIADSGIDDKELKNAKDFIIGSFGLNLDKNENLAAFLISMQIYNLGPDYLNKRNDYFKSVSLEQVNSLAKRLVRSENLIFIKVGP